MRIIIVNGSMSMPPTTCFSDLTPWQRRTLCGLRWRLTGTTGASAPAHPLLDTLIDDLRHAPCRPICCGALPDHRLSHDERLILAALAASRHGRDDEVRRLLGHLLKPSAVRSAASRLARAAGPRRAPEARLARA